LLQDVTALDESGNSIHGTQINVTALYDKPANQWSEGVKCVNGSMIELSYFLMDGSVESLALPLRCAGSGTACLARSEARTTPAEESLAASPFC